MDGKVNPGIKKLGDGIKSEWQGTTIYVLNWIFGVVLVGLLVWAAIELIWGLATKNRDTKKEHLQRVPMILLGAGIAAALLTGGLVWMFNITNEVASSSGAGGSSTPPSN